jgi:transcriptional regulator with XRE-family HTH domain
VDREQLADFLRRRRAALQPDDVGLPPGQRRRTEGLRREEVAGLAGMSTDYLARLEQQRGPQPSESMLAAIARALRLTQAERDHLFRLAGHTPPAHPRRSDHVSPALMRVLDRLDAPAMVVTDLDSTLVQNDLAVALLGEQTHHRGLSRYLLYRWFTDPAEREIYPPEDRPHHQRTFVANLRLALSRDPGDPRTLELIEALHRTGDAFTTAWAEHHVGKKSGERKRLVHPELGVLELDCQTLVAADEGQSLLVFTATPGSEAADRLRLLRVIGRQRLSTALSS